MASICSSGIFAEPSAGMRVNSDEPWRHALYTWVSVTSYLPSRQVRMLRASKVPSPLADPS